MVQYFVDAKLEFDASYIYEDVNHAIRHVHLSGLVHKGILSDPHTYLVKNVRLEHLVSFFPYKYFQLILMLMFYNIRTKSVGKSML